MWLRRFGMHEPEISSQEETSDEDDGEGKKIPSLFARGCTGRVLLHGIYFSRWL